MISRIAVALDGSEVAEQALPYAEGLARAAGGSCLLIQAVPAETSGSGDPELRRAAQAYLTAIAAQLRTRGVNAEVAVAAGEPTSAIVDEAARRGADLLVLTTHGRSGLGRLVYGSVAQSVLERVVGPVLLVQAGEAPVASFPPAEVGPILVPVDGSPFGEAALPVAIDLAKALGTGLHLVEVVVPIELMVQTGAGPVPYIPADLIEAEDEAALSYLDKLVARLRRQGLNAHRTERTDTAAAGILATADETKASVIAMSTHGRSGVSRAILGSVALDVLHHGTRPVVFVRPQG
jgi:nucleotide-binding universal stress UspA family protein